MATFSCHCGTGTVTGSATPNPDPVLTFTCDNHAGGGSRELAEGIVTGSPADVETMMTAMKQPIDDNEQWFIDNPAPAKLTMTLIVS